MNGCYFGFWGWLLTKSEGQPKGGRNSGRFFNHERPHEALANETPGSIYVPSTRLLPSRVKSFVYPRSFQTRRVNNSGDISWHKGRVFVSEVLRNEEIGLEQMDEENYRVFFCSTELGEFNSSDMRFRPALRA